MPHAKGHIRDSQVCLYTNTPDRDFIVDVHPASPEQVVVVSACSGHGFKFATVVGEIASELVATGTSQHDVSLFRMSRFESKVPPH
jgi:glycine/D-amino acid oxidase-like deaminating enzyme